MKNLLKNILNFRKTNNFPDARSAYQLATYQDTLTKDQLRDQLIESLKKRIKDDIKIYKKHMDITTYEGYREKLVLPEVADFFRGLSYNVDVLSEGNYQDVNVLIINWQGLETFK